MKLTITHTTRYSYEEPVSYALQKVRLHPLSSHLQEVTRWSLDVEGGRVETGYRDHYGNHVDLVSAEVGTTEMTITASGEVVTKDAHGIFGRVYTRAPLWHFLLETPLTQSGEAIEGLAETFRASKGDVDGVHALAGAVLDLVPYQTEKTHALTTAEEAIAIGHGVCQDHTHIFISAARRARIPARYVSGYLRMDGQNEQDASHAWAEAHLDGLGWVGVDVSNGISPDERYVRVAVGRDARDTAPISGLRMGSGDETMIVSLQVQQ